VASRLYSHFIDEENATGLAAGSSLDILTLTTSNGICHAGN
jgi:hypothetical protein